MNLRDQFDSALWGLRSRPMRTGALVLSLAAGVTAAVFVATVIAGFGKEIDRLAFGAYASAIVINENAFVRDRHGPPGLSDRALLSRELEEHVESALWKSGRSTAYQNGRQLDFAVFGAVGAYEHEVDSPIREGRSLTKEELEGTDRVCLLGAEVADELGDAAVGRSLRIGSVACEVVGILGEPRSRPAARFSNAVITPLRTAERYFLLDDPRRPGDADNITVFVAPQTDMAVMEMKIDLLLRKHRGAPLSHASPFTYGDDNASIEQLVAQRAMLSRLLGSLAVLSLVTSLTAFAAIGAAAMAARRREIALRLALGATGRDVQQQILIENLLVGIGGGTAGLVAGLALGKAAALAWSWPFAPDPGAAAVAIVLGLAVGLGVGFVLAGQAARVAPSLAARG